MAKSVKGVRRSLVADEKRDKTRIPSVGAVTHDSFQNFMAGLGIGTDNVTSASAYGFNPITRIRTLLDWMYRGSWLAGVAIDVVADDMTRAGVSLRGDIDPDDIKKVNEAAIRLGIWTKINEVIRWSRLYGGCIGVILVDGQRPETPLRVEAVGKEQFKGILVLDRWMVEPSLQDLVTEVGPNLGDPKFYTVTAQAPAFSGKKIHYSRCIRLIGNKLPYWQALIENLWGESILERLYDRMVAFDSATTGAAQLVYKAFIRTYKIKDLRQVVAAGGDQLQGLQRYVEMMRKMQGIEGITLIDGEDELENFTQTGFSGLSDALIQFGQQLAGALQIPLVRLFGQAPAGLNATGESDLRMYYDGIRQRQVSEMQVPVTNIYRMLAASEGIKLKDGFGTEFRPLWQLTDREKADIASVTTSCIQGAEESGLVDRPTALRELKQQSEVTGVWTNVTEEAIKQSELEPPPDAMAGEEGEEPSAPGAGKPSPHPEAPGKGWVSQKREGAKGGIGRAVASDELPRNKWPIFSATLTKENPYQSIIEKVRAPSEKEAIGYFKKWANEHGYEFKEIYHREEVKTKDFSSRAAQLAFHHGLQAVVENPEGSVRRGHGWVTSMPADYGYIRRAEGADGDPLDCFIGPSPESPHVFVIDQKDLATGAFDEHKVMLGYWTKESAEEDYVLSYTDATGPKRIMALSSLNMDEFKTWLAEGDSTKPYSALTSDEKKVTAKNVFTGRTPSDLRVNEIKKDIKILEKAIPDLSPEDQEYNRQKIAKLRAELGATQ